MSGALLALDAGQTGTKARITATESAPVELVLPGVRTADDLFAQLHAITAEAQRRTGVAVETVAAGVSGLTDDVRDASRLLQLLGGSGVQRVLLAHDSVTSYLGALGDAHGAVVAAGTGVVTLAVGPTRFARVDGWGYIMGDAGSGHWIGREALEAAMRDHDGRGPHTRLTDLVRERWPDLESAYIDLQQDEDRVRIVASFAEHVAALAEIDEVAATICLRAAQELAHSATTALARVAADDSEPVQVAATGNLFRSTLIHSRFEELVSESAASARFVSARGTGLDGVATMPDLDRAHPLRTQISDASA